jgi:hypothetical protein
MWRSTDVLLKANQFPAAAGERDRVEPSREKSRNFEVGLTNASTYKEAIEKMSALSYDLITVIMGVHGFDLLLKLRPKRSRP